MLIPFTKMHGLGNNYIYVDLIQYPIDIKSLPKLAIKISNVNTGIGSDGLILIAPSQKADVMMRIFNKDGSEAKNCGNGLRCVAKYAYEQKIVQTKLLSIETLSGVVTAEVKVKNQCVISVTIDMGEPVVQRRKIPMAGEPGQEPVINKPFKFGGHLVNITAVSMGNPHALLFEENMNMAPIEILGPLLSDGHEMFPEGVNVGFIEKKLGNVIRYRVWERGSGITQACGTGACAAVVASILEGRLQKGQTIEVILDGGPLFICWHEENEHVYMTGTATTVCNGQYFYQEE